MSIASTDLILYASANMPNDDSATSGGAIDQLRRIDFTQMAANDTIEMVSSASGDTTQTLTVTSRKADGTVVTEARTMNGTTTVTFPTSATVERVIKAELSATCAGTITLRRTTGPTTIRTIPIGERGFMAFLRQASSDPSTQQDFYIKGFWLNNHGSLALLGALVKENADPDARITHALDASVNASTSTTNRKTTPGFTFDGTDKAVPGTDLAAGSKIGVWFKVTLPAADAAHRTTYTSQITGSST